MNKFKVGIQTMQNHLTIGNLILKEKLSHNDIVALLKTEGSNKQLLFNKSAEIKRDSVQDRVYFRGLIEFSNYCRKNCYYCGIRKDNPFIERFNLTDSEILEAAKFAHINKYGSIVLQSGELESKVFTNRITKLLDQISDLSDGKLRVTVSCGEQSYDTYKQWFVHGASRYLLRIETSNIDLYYKLHPNDPIHSFERRVGCLNDLRDIGYQVGTGVMIGLPFQTIDHLADDLIWIREINADMVGMGPYLEHENTPLANTEDLLFSIEERFELSLKMIAILRIMMKDINIAASTAMQAIDKLGREKAIKVGANVIMPNITPGEYRDAYKLYDNKPCTDENPEDCKTCLELRIVLTKNDIALGEWGDSLHFIKRKNTDF